MNQAAYEMIRRIDRASDHAEGEDLFRALVCLREALLGPFREDAALAGDPEWREDCRAFCRAAESGDTGKAAVLFAYLTAGPGTRPMKEITDSAEGLRKACGTQRKRIRLEEGAREICDVLAADLPEEEREETENFRRESRRLMRERYSGMIRLARHRRREETAAEARQRMEEIRRIRERWFDPEKQMETEHRTATEKELLEADGEKFETFFADQRIKPEKAGLGMCRENPGKEGEKADVYETEE